MSGFCVSAARLALPDAGLISYGEMLDTGRYSETLRPSRQLDESPTVVQPLVMHEVKAGNADAL